MKRNVLAWALLASVLSAFLVPSASASVKAGANCSYEGQIGTSQGKKFNCVKSGKKLVWKQAPLAPVVKLKTSDIQFFYATGGCKNELGFQRMNETGKILSKKVILKTSLNIQLIPESYESGQLLFSTYNCDNSEYALFNLNVGQSSYIPSELLKFPKGTMIIDAKWDVATDTPLALVSYGAREFVVMTANISKSVLWSSTAQGWGQRGIYPTILISSTGREFTVFGDNLSSGGWTSTHVNFGVSSRGSETQYKGSGKLIDVEKSWMDAPYAVGLDSGIYLCSDFPTTSTFNKVLNIESSEFCNKISSTRPFSRGSLGFSLIANGSTNSSNEILINSNYGKGFSYKLPGLFGTGAKIKDFKELTFSNIYYTYIVGSFELSFNIGDTAPSLTLQDGYFSSY